MRRLSAWFFRLEPWLALAAYLPSFLVLGMLAPGLARLSFHDSVLIGATAYAAVSTLLSSAVLATGLVPAWSRKWRQVRGWRWERIFLACNWLPHHAAVCTLGLWLAFTRDGFIT